MKNTIVILSILLFMVTNLNAQEKMNVHYRDGNTRTVDVSEIKSITFTFSEQEEEGVVINGIRWATRNVNTPGTFTVTPEDAGMFYQWNRKVGWSTTDPLINSDGGTTWNSSTPSGTTWKKENDPCPSGWRVPTNAELISLAEADSLWTNLYGVDGHIFGSDEQFIFLPAADHRIAGTGKLNHMGMFTRGYYWSSSKCDVLYHTDDAYFLSFVGGGVQPSGYWDRRFGQLVRCVADSKNGKTP